jgi:murein DD-endopeptidase MepM/ murein hydrolase activator NlpD
MNIILVPGSKNGKGEPACLSHRHLFVIALVGLVLLPVFLGVMIYRFHSLLDSGSTAAVQERALAVQRVAIIEARKNAEAHLNALARRLGEMQAEMLRLNALGSRLTKMAGLDPREFSFDTLPGVGGPEQPDADATGPRTFEELDKLSTQIESQRERLIALETLLLDRKLTSEVTPSGWPVDGGWVSSGYGLRADPFTGHQSFHEGVDVASRLGSPILAMGDGIVTHAGDRAGLGLALELTHESGLVTRYAHTRAILVKEGERVKKGQTVALVGSSGRSTGPHLHIEVLRDGVAVNPAPYLRAE